MLDVHTSLAFPHFYPSLPAFLYSLFCYGLPLHSHFFFDQIIPYFIDVYFYFKYLTISIRHINAIFSVTYKEHTQLCNIHYECTYISQTKMTLHSKPVDWHYVGKPFIFVCVRMTIFIWFLDHLRWLRNATTSMPVLSWLEWHLNWSEDNFYECECWSFKHIQYGIRFKVWIQCVFWFAWYRITDSTDILNVKANWCNQMCVHIQLLSLNSSSIWYVLSQWNTNIFNICWDRAD